jgi:hypothetical protein
MMAHRVWVKNTTQQKAMTSRRAITVFGAVLGLATLTSCNTYRVVETVRSLNQVEVSQNEWGKITVSDFSLVANKGQFKVTANEDVTNYIQAARLNISGAASSAQQSALFLAGQMQASFVPPVSAGSPPTTTNASALPALPTQAGTAISTFSTPANINGLTPATDERDAVEKGINDKTAENLLEYLLNPTVNSNKEAVVFGVMQATCQPGQRTRNGYVGELDVNLMYAKNGAAWDTNIYPQVLGVLPLMDTKNLEFRNSNESQIELALALQAAFAAKGMTAAANLLSDYVKREQANVDTRNQDPVVTTYANNDTFGFQIYPSLTAVEQPGKSSSKAGYNLEPVTFPLVVAVLVNKDLIASNAIDSVEVRPQTRWIGMKSSFLSSLENGYWQSLGGHFLEGYYVWGALNKGSLSLPIINDFPGNPVFQRLQRGLWLDRANNKLNKLSHTDFTNKFQYTYAELDTAFRALRSSTGSEPSFCILPALSELFPPSTTDTNSPVIAGVYPHQIWRDRPTEFTLVLTGVTDAKAVDEVLVHGQKCLVTNSVAYSTKTTSGAYKLAGIALNVYFDLPNSSTSLTNYATNNIEFAVYFTNTQLTNTVNLATITADGSSALTLNPLEGETQRIDIGNAGDLRIDATKLTLEVNTNCTNCTNCGLKVVNSGPGSTILMVTNMTALQTNINIMKTNATLTVSADEVEADYSYLSSKRLVTMVFKNSPTNLTFSPGQNSFTVSGREASSTALKPAYLSVPMTLIGNPEQNPATVIARDAAEKIIGIEIKGEKDAGTNADMAKRILNILEISERVPGTLNIVH